MRYNVFSDLAVPGRHGKSSTFRLSRAWLSLVEHSVRDRGVGGSNPLAPTNFSRLLATNLQRTLRRSLTGPPVFYGQRRSRSRVGLAPKEPASRVLGRL